MYKTNASHFSMHSNAWGSTPKLFEFIFTLSLVLAKHTEFYLQFSDPTKSARESALLRLTSNYCLSVCLADWLPARPALLWGDAPPRMKTLMIITIFLVPMQVTKKKKKKSSRVPSSSIYCLSEALLYTGCSAPSNFDNHIQPNLWVNFFIVRQGASAIC